MVRSPPVCTSTYTRLPDTALCRSVRLATARERCRCPAVGLSLGFGAGHLRRGGAGRGAGGGVAGKAAGVLGQVTDDGAHAIVGGGIDERAALSALDDEHDGHLDRKSTRLNSSH